MNSLESECNASPAPVNSKESDFFSESIKFATKLSDKNSLAVIYTKEDSEELKVKADSKYLDDENNSGDSYLVNLTHDFDQFSQFSAIYENLSRSSKATVSAANLAEMSGRSTYTSMKTDDENNRDRISFQYKYDNPDNDKFLKLFSTFIIY